MEKVNQNHELKKNYFETYMNFMKRYWLYGEIQERDDVRMNPTERRCPRGWFPRLCCSPTHIEYEFAEKNE